MYKYIKTNVFIHIFEKEDLNNTMQPGQPVKAMMRYDAGRGTRLTPTGGTIIGSCPSCLEEGQVGMVCEQCNADLRENLGLCHNCGTWGQQFNPCTKG